MSPLCCILPQRWIKYYYVRDYGNIQAYLLKYFGEQDSIFLNELYESISNIALMEEMQEDRQEYLSCFKETLSDSDILKLQGYLLSKNISWEIEKKDNIESEFEKESKPLDKFDLFNKKYSEFNGKNKEDLIDEGVNAFNEERVSIWFSNWSTSSNTAKDNLKTLFNSDLDVFSNLKVHINKYSVETWIIIRKLLWFLEAKLSNNQIVELYQIASEHFSFLIRPDNKALEKYDWIDSSCNENNNDENIVKFIIWLLNHPVYLAYSRTFNALKDLARFEPNLTIPLIIEELLSEKPQISTERCSAVLKNISDSNPELIVDVLKNKAVLVEKLVSIKHFSIKINMLDVSINLNKTGYSGLYDMLSESFPVAVVLVGEVALDEDYLEPIMFEIDELNKLQILNKSFCETLLINIKEYCKPLSIKDYIKSDKYLNRSFSLSQSESGRFKILLHYALNLSVTPRVDRKNMQKVFEILNY